LAWTTGELVSASDMNAIGKNLATLGNKATTVSGATTSIDANLGNEFVDLDSNTLNLTITTAGGV